MAQKPMLRGEVGARALRNPVGRKGGCGTCSTMKPLIWKALKAAENRQISAL
jgi:hypothetical protein